ncbi:hypothetical protein AB5N19_11716 [Seiridium cardinale]|uniref:Uncharacterized protein n=1 Tax=Seiridium cardinale TaxID=138064 RepID=A0ABR2XE84_9PEZI
MVYTLADHIRALRDNSLSSTGPLLLIPIIVWFKDARKIHVREYEEYLPIRPLMPLTVQQLFELLTDIHNTLARSNQERNHQARVLGMRIAKNERPPRCATFGRFDKLRDLGDDRLACWLHWGGTVTDKEKFCLIVDARDEYDGSDYPDDYINRADYA